MFINNTMNYIEFYFWKGITEDDRIGLLYLQEKPLKEEEFCNKFEYSKGKRISKRLRGYGLLTLKVIHGVRYIGISSKYKGL